MDYLNIKEASEILGISTQKVYRLHKKNTFTDVINSKNRLLISESDILNYKMQLELLDSMYSIAECADLLKLSFGNLYTHYVVKGFFTTSQKINGQYYITKNEILSLLESNKQYYSMIDFKTCEEAAKHLNIHIETVYRYISRGLFPNALKSCFYSSPWKIPNSDIEVFSNYLNTYTDINNKEKKNTKGIKSLSTTDVEILNNYYTVQQVANYVDSSANTIYKRIKEGLFKDIITINRKSYISKIEVHATPSKLIKSKKINSDMTLDEIISLRLAKVANAERIKGTLESLKRYLFYKYPNTRMKNKNVLMYSICNMFVDLSDRLEKELYYYTDSEIIYLISLVPKYKKQLIGFLNFILNEKSGECKFENKYNYTAKVKNLTDKQIYSKKDFKMFYQYVKDINRHKENALSSLEFAETWFYIFMHMTNAWRSSDVLHFPSINFFEISNDHIEQILAEEIHIADAQTIVNIVSEQWEKFIINKTKILNKFLVNPDMVQTAATIFLIIEMHNRKNNFNSEYLLHSLQHKSRISPLAKKFFESEPLLKPFSSRIANRSLITYFFHSVSSGSNNGDVSHLLAQKLRRHISQDTISQYVMNTNEDEYLDDTTYNLFKRGHFGWLYNSLVDIVVYNKESKLSIDEKTKLIELFQKQYSPSEIEEISDYFLERQNKQKSVALEIALLPDDEIERRLYSIFMGSMPSKEENSQCFYSNNCKNPTGNCKTCCYIIPRTHLLISLKNDLEEIISKILNLSEHDIFERARNTHLLYRLLDLVSQAIKSFDKRYVNSFIPLEGLHSSLKEISDKVYLYERK